MAKRNSKSSRIKCKFMKLSLMDFIEAQSVERPQLQPDPLAQSTRDFTR